MKKMIYIIVVILGGFVVLGLVTAVVLSMIETRIPAMSGDSKFTYGPYACNGKSLTIEQTFWINSLEGASSLSDITVTYGENLVFKNINTFKDALEKKAGTTFQFDDYQNYLASTQKEFVTLPSQEELIARGLQPTEQGFIMLGSVSAASSQDLQSLADCFKQNTKLIYDHETGGTPKPPFYVYYDKAYLLKM